MPSVWLETVQAGSASRYIRNVETKVFLRDVGGASIPLTLNDSEFENAFVCSPLTQCLKYPKEELKLLKNAALEKIAGMGIDFVESFFRKSQFNKVIQINNWLMTTNSWIDSLQPQSVIQLSKDLIQEFPEHSVFIRCLPELQMKLLKSADGNPFQFYKVREVYHFDGTTASYLRKDVVKRDRKLFGKGDYEILRGKNVLRSEAQRLVDLYSNLYLEKHSRLNPEFTKDFVELCCDQGFLNWIALRSRETNKIDAVVGLLQIGNELTTPFMGYDTKLPQDLGLYRRLFLLTLDEAAERKCLLNFSSGAGEFKRRRGGEPRWEYSAVATSHLNLRRQWPWKLVQSVANSIGPAVMTKA